MATSIDQLRFELTAGALSEQERALTGLRTCAGTVLGAASIAASFLGTRAGSGSLDVWAIMATISFALCFSSAIWVLAPHQLVLAFGGSRLLAHGDSWAAGDLSDAYRAAGRWIEPHLEINRRKIGRLANWLSASCLLLAVEVVLWTLSITG